MLVRNFRNGVRDTEMLPIHHHILSEIGYDSKPGFRGEPDMALVEKSSGKRFLCDCKCVKRLSHRNGLKVSFECLQAQTGYLISLVCYDQADKDNADIYAHVLLQVVASEYENTKREANMMLNENYLVVGNVFDVNRSLLTLRVLSVTDLSKQDWTE